MLLISRKQRISKSIEIIDYAINVILKANVKEKSCLGRKEIIAESVIGGDF